MLVKNIPHIYRFQWLNKLFFLILFCPSSLFSSWADDTLKSLSLREKISQMFMVSAITHGEQENISQLCMICDDYPFGGILFKSGELELQIQAYNFLQKISSTPILSAIDGEWGLNMRISQADRFPRNLALGALQDTNLIYQMGEAVAHQCKASCVHLNFAPVVDINNNPLNPVINDRSFGEDPNAVAEKASLFMQGLQNNGILACAKHFPGHGDTSIDSHLSLPVINKSVDELKNLEWKPFDTLIQGGVSSIMTAHLLFPLISDSCPASLSKTFINTYLKDELNFDGLVITDCLQMKAITSKFGENHAEFLAIVAGSDLILNPADLKSAVDYIHKQTINNKIVVELIDEHVLKILKVKEKLKLHLKANSKELPLNTAESKKLKKELFEKCITCVQNKGVKPLKNNNKVAFVQIGRDVLMKSALEITKLTYEKQYPKEQPPLFDYLQENLSADYFFLPKLASSEKVNKLLNDLKPYDKIVIGVYEMNKFASKNHGVCASTISFLDNLNKTPTTSYLCLFGSPYSLKYFNDQNLILMAYENDIDVQIGVGKILMGKMKAEGKLPITASKKYSLGLSIQSPTH